MAHDHRLPIGDRLKADVKAPDPSQYRIVPLPLRVLQALEALDRFASPLFAPSYVVRTSLQKAIDETEAAIREALNSRRY